MILTIGLTDKDPIELTLSQSKFMFLSIHQIISQIVMSPPLFQGRWVS